MTFAITTSLKLCAHRTPRAAFRVANDVQRKTGLLQASNVTNGQNAHPNGYKLKAAPAAIKSAQLR
jgi:hypothetical protein